MRLTVVQRGQLKDPAVQGLVDDYCKRFRRFGRLEVCEHKHPRWPQGAWRVLCDERGEQLTSPGLAARLAEWSMRHGDCCFAIGDGDGHDAEFAAAADARFSLGLLTLPHRLAHLVLVEQLYRAATIQAGLPYHHA